MTDAAHNTKPRPPDPLLDALKQQALGLGASAAAVVAPDRVIVREDLAVLCQDPGCPNHGLSGSCPPHVEGPEGMRGMLRGAGAVLVFRLDAPVDLVLSSERAEIMAVIHQIAAAVELEAVKQGFTASRGFAGGSCKRIFCENEPDCQVAAHGGPCRNPDVARPSMSGYGVDVNALAREAGWPSPQEWKAENAGESVMPLYGMVILGRG